MTTITQFSDLDPTDWGCQALSKLDGQYSKHNASAGVYNARHNVFGSLVMTTCRF